jgi:3-hydroxybutyryl-CoA dehydrogenase
VIVGIVGAGTMGAGIAQVCLQAGHEVVLHDVDAAAIERGRGRIAEGLERLVAKGRLEAGARDDALARLRSVETLAGLAAGAELVIEAALEDLELKRTIFRALDEAASADAILATNTSALSVAAIGGATGQPGRVLGLHFFNPAPVMELVEVVAAETTDDAVVRAGLDFCLALGKTPVACRDTPGFIVNRVNRPFTLEALRMLEAGEAGIEAVDAALTEAGYPMGPFRLMDLVGVDVNFAVAEALYEGFDEEPRFRPSPIQVALVESRQLGRKTGAGFYRYGSGSAPLGPADLPPGLELGTIDEPLPGAGIVERIELAIINEAYHAAGEEVAAADDIDRALRLGANHPRGPFERAGELGLRRVVEGLQQLSERYGPRFRVAPALWRIANA